MARHPRVGMGTTGHARDSQSTPARVRTPRTPFCRSGARKRCMCGIAGFVDLAAARARTVESDRGRLKAMCDVMRYRGPDDEGFFVAPGVGLGMRRLSIIDLAGGHQPIANED